MVKVLMMISIMVIFMSGCTRTIQGIQEDSRNAWEGAKSTIHNATAP